MKPRGDAPRQVDPSDADARYARQLVLDDVGPVGQQRLARARVLVVGAGGLGSAALTQLAAVGVGTIGVADADVVELSNLQRQVIHSETDLGRAKVDSAAERLVRLNSTVRVHRHRVRLDDTIAADLVQRYDLVIDACDNDATRHAVSRACTAWDRPHVWGAVAATGGQLSVWWAGRGPCLRCVFPHTEPVTVDAARVGVLGPVPAVIGTLQSIEAVKIITGSGRPMVGRLLVFEAMTSTWSQLDVRPRADCACRTAGPRDGPHSRSPATVAGQGSPSAQVADDVLDLVDLIPSGCVVTYGDLAERLSQAYPRRVGAREVGRVMASLGAAVPWWRVVDAAGRLPVSLRADAARHWGQEGTPTRPGQADRVDLNRARMPVPSWPPVVGGR